MKPTILFALIGCVVGLSILAVRELKRQRNAEDHLPVSSQVTPEQVQRLVLANHNLVAIEGTGSMKPFIPEGDGIVAYADVEVVPFSSLRSGDVVIYQRPNYAVIHQLDSLDTRGWAVSGLGNSFYDYSRVTSNNLRGRVTHVYILK